MARINKKVDSAPAVAGAEATIPPEVSEPVAVFTKGIRVRSVHGYPMHNPYSQERIEPGQTRDMTYDEWTRVQIAAGLLVIEV